MSVTANKIAHKLSGNSPLDGRALTLVALSTPEDVEQAVRLARAAQAGWQSRPLDVRIRALKNAAQNMLRDREAILSILREEAGKLEVDALISEALGPLDQVSSWAKVVSRELEPRSVFLNPVAFPNKRASYQLVPRGVIGCITPWNYPIATFFRPVLPALLCGNSVVVKPSEHTPRSAEWFLGHIQREIPSGVLSVVQGGAEIGTALINAGIDSCTFTGSVATGRKVLHLCAEQLIPCNVELGGKDAAILLEDCDLDRAVAGITHWALHNAGQACGAIEIAFVPNGIADTFVARMTRAWKQLRYAPGEFAEVDVSPLTLASQRDTVERHVERALSQGAVLCAGGKRYGEGLGYEATLLDHCNANMEVVQEETFGPVLAIVRYSNLDEALQLVNSSKYGLTASVWTKDVQRGKRIGERLRVGVVTVNNHSLSGAMTGLPWSGTRSTGFGISNSALALGAFTRPQATVVDRATAPEPFWLPHSRDLFDLGNVLADAQIGRLGGAWKLPGLLKRRTKQIRAFFS